MAEIAIEAPPVGNLRDQTAIRHARGVTVTVAPGLAVGQHGLQLAQPIFDPVAIPGVLLLFADLEDAVEIFEDTQVVERVNIAGHQQRQGAHPRAIRRPLRQQGRGRRAGFLQILDDRERLRDRIGAVDQRGHQQRRIDRLIRRALVGPLDQMNERRFIGQPLQVQRDAHPVRGRGTKVGVELHEVRLSVLVRRENWPASRR